MNRKELIRDYKNTPRPAGVYQVQNKVSKKTLIGSSSNLPGILNRARFQLEHGSHPDRELQKDFNDYGPDAFEFEVLDQLEPSNEPGYDLGEDLKTLKDMWLEKLKTAGVDLYAHSERGA